MRLHILGPGFSTFVRSVRLYCEEKALDYTHGMHVDGNTIRFHSPEHMALHPFGKVPVLLHGERSVIETTTICRYLDEAFAHTSPRPADLAQKVKVDQWSATLAMYADDRLIRRYLLLLVSPAQPSGSIDRDAVAIAEPMAIQTLGLLAKQLDGQQFFCGADYSMADAILTPMLDYLERVPESAQWLKKTSNLRDYLFRMRLRQSGLNVLTEPNFS
ncbi:MULTISPECIES: glutathione S-transferase family protein [Pseudomonas]|uniref:glutathione S-transferase family protein n=1 Tax=Pseudomonas sp. BF-R-19 TaxID=2832397 RepID=UPI001CBC15D5|nr:glutathione S-transferase family protein [Pseudomonas sp. BF-R-19]